MGLLFILLVVLAVSYLYSIAVRRALARSRRYEGSGFNTALVVGGGVLGGGLGAIVAWLAAPGMLATLPGTLAYLLLLAVTSLAVSLAALVLLGQRSTLH